METFPSNRKMNPFYEKKYISIVKNIVLNETKNIDCQIFLFGSRVDGSARFGSDIDIGIKGLTKELFDKIRSRILLKIEESIVPHDVDIVNFEIANKDYRINAERKQEIWKKS
jgi:predicted nucleotidyltransferase